MAIAQPQAHPCRFISIEDDSALKGNKDLEIRVKADPDAKTITIECAHGLSARLIESRRRWSNPCGADIPLTFATHNCGCSHLRGICTVGINLSLSSDI